MSIYIWMRRVMLKVSLIYLQKVSTQVSLRSLRRLTCVETCLLPVKVGSFQKVTSNERMVIYDWSQTMWTSLLSKLPQAHLGKLNDTSVPNNEEKTGQVSPRVPFLNFVHINSFPNDKFLDLSKSKAFADDKINVTTVLNWNLFWEG